MVVIMSLDVMLIAGNNMHHTRSGAINNPRGDVIKPDCVFYVIES